MQILQLFDKRYQLLRFIKYHERFTEKILIICNCKRNFLKFKFNMSHIFVKKECGRFFNLSDEDDYIKCFAKIISDTFI